MISLRQASQYFRSNTWDFLSDNQVVLLRSWAVNAHSLSPTSQDVQSEAQLLPQTIAVFDGLCEYESWVGINFIHTSLCFEWAFSTISRIDCISKRIVSLGSSIFHVEISKVRQRLIAEQEGWTWDHLADTDVVNRDALSFIKTYKAHSLWIPSRNVYWEILGKWRITSR